MISDRPQFRDEQPVLVVESGQSSALGRTRRLPGGFHMPFGGAVFAPSGVDMSGRGIARAVGLCLLVLGLLYQSFLLLYALKHSGNDFGKFYYATKYWRGGTSMYATSPATLIPVSDTESRQFLDMNAPHVHVLVLPFTGWSVRRATLAWLIVNLYLGFLAVVLTIREARVQFGRRHVLPAALAVVFCAATAATTVTGQFTGLLMLLTVVAWQAMRGEQETKAGIWLGILIGLKPFLGLFLAVLCIVRRWRTVAVALATLGATFAAAIAVFGMEQHRAWLQALGAVDWTWAPMNGSVYGLLTRCFAASPYFTPFVENRPAIVGLWAASSAAIVALTVAAWRRSVDHGVAATLLASLLVSPLGWVYYAWLAVAPCTALWARRRPSLVVVGFVCLLVPFFATVAGQPHAWATATIGSAYTWGLLALWAGVLTTPTVDPSV
jgi:hypothetical protein